MWVAFFLVYFPSFAIVLLLCLYFCRRRRPPCLISGVLAVPYAHRGEEGREEGRRRRGESRRVKKDAHFSHVFMSDSAPATSSSPSSFPPLVPSLFILSPFFSMMGAAPLVVVAECLFFSFLFSV